MPRPHGRDHGLDLLVAEHLVQPGALHIENLAPQRQYGLNGRIAALLGRTAGRVTLHDEQLAQGGVLALAIGQLAGQLSCRTARPCAAPKFLGLARGLPRPSRIHHLFHDELGVLGVFLQERADLLVHQGGHQTRDLAVAQLSLGLALELGHGQLHADYRGKTLAYIVARKFLSLSFLGRSELAT